MKRLLSPVLVLLLTGPVFGLSMESQVKQYSGDGAIRNCSLFLSPGYSSEFPKFDAAQPYKASYRLSHVPQMARDPLILLRFYQRDFVAARERKRSVTATFRVTLSDAQGHIQHSASLPLATSWWGESRGLFGIFDSEQSKLHFDRNASYILRVSYKPGSVPPFTKQIYFSVEACGK